MDPGSLERAVTALRAGGLIAYPTEAVFGLGCDPWCEAAFDRLLALKGRDADKGVILVAASFAQVEPLIAALPEGRRAELLATWPGAFTWICPASSRVPEWITGRHSGVALRVSAHPVVAALCTAFGRPLVSTSANRSGDAPLRDAATVHAAFGAELDAIIDEPVGGMARPTPIRDALSGEWLRY